MESMTVAPEHVVEVLCRTEHGRAMWRAAQYEALTEALAARVRELETQHAPTGAQAEGGVGG